MSLASFTQLARQPAGQTGRSDAAAACVVDVTDGAGEVDPDEPPQPVATSTTSESAIAPSFGTRKG